MPLIAVVTPLFPIKEEPYRGNAIYQTVVNMQRHADIEVICPVAVYPPLLVPRYRYHRVDPSYRPEGVNTRYIEYPAVPVLSRPLNGALCARRILPDLQKLNPDLILNYWLYPEGYSSVQIARRLGKPVIVASRGSDLRRIGDPITRRLVRHTVNAADFVLTVSEDLRSRVVQMGVPSPSDALHSQRMPPYRLPLRRTRSGALAARNRARPEGHPLRGLAGALQGRARAAARLSGAGGGRSGAAPGLRGRGRLPAEDPGVYPGGGSRGPGPAAGAQRPRTGGRLDDGRGCILPAQPFRRMPQRGGRSGSPAAVPWWAPGSAESPSW